MLYIYIRYICCFTEYTVMANSLEKVFKKAIAKHLPEELESDNTSEDEVMWSKINRYRYNVEKGGKDEPLFAAEIANAFKKLDQVIN